MLGEGRGQGWGPGIMGSSSEIGVYVYMAMLLVVHITCMCRRVHVVHVHMCMRLCQMVMVIVCVHGYVYMRICYCLCKCIDSHGLIYSPDLPPADICCLGVTRCCLTLGGGWSCIKCEAVVGDEVGMGLRMRGCYYHHHVCLTTLSLPFTLMGYLDSMAAYHGPALACHEGGG